MVAVFNSSSQNKTLSGTDSQSVTYTANARESLNLQILDKTANKTVTLDTSNSSQGAQVNVGSSVRNINILDNGNNDTFTVNDGFQNLSVHALTPNSHLNYQLNGTGDGIFDGGGQGSATLSFLSKQDLQDNHFIVNSAKDGNPNDFFLLDTETGQSMEFDNMSQVLDKDGNNVLSEAPSATSSPVPSPSPTPSPVSGTVQGDFNYDVNDVFHVMENAAGNYNPEFYKDTLTKQQLQSYINQPILAGTNGANIAQSLLDNFDILSNGQDSLSIHNVTWNISALDGNAKNFSSQDVQLWAQKNGDSGAAPTPSPSPTPTPTPTPGPSPSPISSPTPTPTPGPSPSPISSPTPTPTPGPSPSPISSPTPTPTPGVSPSPISSPTPTPTPGPSPSPISSPTPTPTSDSGSSNSNLNQLLQDILLLVVLNLLGLFKPSSGNNTTSSLNGFGSGCNSTGLGLNNFGSGFNSFGSSFNNLDSGLSPFGTNLNTFGSGLPF